MLSDFVWIQIHKFLWILLIYIGFPNNCHIWCVSAVFVRIIKLRQNELRFGMSLAFNELSLCHVTEVALVKICSYNGTISFWCSIEIFFVHNHNFAELSRCIDHISIINDFLDVVGVWLCSWTSIIAAVSITNLLYIV